MDLLTRYFPDNFYLACGCIYSLLVDLSKLAWGSGLDVVYCCHVLVQGLSMVAIGLPWRPWSCFWGLWAEAFPRKLCHDLQIPKYHNINYSPVKIKFVVYIIMSYTSFVIYMWRNTFELFSTELCFKRQFCVKDGVLISQGWTEWWPSNPSNSVVGKDYTKNYCKSKNYWNDAKCSYHAKTLCERPA